jgi:hypothetical protein
VDATVVYTAAHTGFTLASAQGGKAALDAEQDKLENAPTLSDPTHSFIPFAVDDWGRLAPMASGLLSKLAKHVGEHSSGPGDGDGKQVASHLLHKWRQYISVAIHGTSAQVACDRKASSRRARDIFTSDAA